VNDFFGERAPSPDVSDGPFGSFFDATTLLRIAAWADVMNTGIHDAIATGVAATVLALLGVKDEVFTNETTGLFKRRRRRN
jgi:hypothetical protein